MTDADLTFIATRIMDRAERDGNGLHLSSIVQELRAGLAIVEAKDRDTRRAELRERDEKLFWTAREIEILTNRSRGLAGSLNCGSLEINRIKTKT